MAVAAFIGAGRVGDAYRAALTIPRLLQNLLGEGVLSASFIPVYAQLLEQDRRQEAGRLAGAVLGLLSVLVSLSVLAGMLLARPLVSVLLWRLPDSTTDLTVELVRIMFAGVGFIVLAAWALGVLNAHRRFFLSYASPIIWNAAQIVLMVAAWVVWHDVDSSDRAADVARVAAWGVAIGGFLQFLIQLPLVLRLLPELRLSFTWRRPDVRSVLNRFTPALAGRGVVQLSAYVDIVLAGLLAGGAIALLGFAQVFYFLPLSLFAVSVAASDLPEMARQQSDPSALLARLRAGLDRTGFYVMFSTLAFITVGRPIVGALLQRGRFTSDETIAVWWVLGAYSLGLMASASARLLQNTCFAAGDVKGPARTATVRVVLAAGLGLAFMFSFDQYAVVDGSVQRLGDAVSFAPLGEAERDAGTVRLGAVGLALGSSLAAWAEYGILRQRVGYLLRTPKAARTPALRLAPAALVLAVLGVVLAWGLEPLHPLLAAPLSLLVLGSVYVVLARGTGVAAADEAARLAERALQRIRTGWSTRRGE